MTMDSPIEKSPQTVDSASKPVDRAGVRPWIAPTFERLSLKEAMAGIRNIGIDLMCS